MEHFQVIMDGRCSDDGTAEIGFGTEAQMRALFDKVLSGKCLGGYDRNLVHLSLTKKVVDEEGVLVKTERVLSANLRDQEWFNAMEEADRILDEKIDAASWAHQVAITAAWGNARLEEEATHERLVKRRMAKNQAERDAVDAAFEAAFVAAGGDKAARDAADAAYEAAQTAAYEERSAVPSFG
jgi:hypothetical protein